MQLTAHHTPQHTAGHTCKLSLSSRPPRSAICTGKLQHHVHTTRMAYRDVIAIGTSSHASSMQITTQARCPILMNQLDCQISLSQQSLHRNLHRTYEEMIIMMHVRGHFATQVNPISSFGKVAGNNAENERAKRRRSKRTNRRLKEYVLHQHGAVRKSK